MKSAFLLAAALLAVPATAAEPPLAASANRVHSHVEFLASDLLEGRDTGSRGHEIAAAYVAGQFRALGLEPAGENGSWYQWVPFRRASAVPGKDSFSLVEDGRATPLTANDISIRPSLTEKTRDLTAGLVFAGFGISEPLLGIDDYAGLDARGKIVVYFRGVPDGQPADIAAHLDASKAETAAAHGAIGVIEIASGRGRQRPGSGTVPAPRPATDWVDSKGVSGSTPPGLRARLSVSTATAERLFAGAPARLADLRATAGSGKRVKGFALRPSLAIRSETAWEDFKSPEVVALLPGADPVLKGQYVAMMGHLDHLGIKKDARPGEDAIYNGALDNAAGVATLLEAARQFVDSGRPPKRSILFTAHTAEEKGLLGADYYARHPTVPIASIVAGVDLDMPVPLYPFTDVVAFGGDHSTLGRAVAQAGREMGIGVSPDPMPEQAIFTRSDHYQFVRAGVPAILLFTGYANGGKAKWDDFFAKRYHTVGDDLSQPILWDAAARYAEFNYRIARILADGPERPLWAQGNYFGDRFNPGGARAKARSKP